MVPSVTSTGQYLGQAAAKAAAVSS